MAQTESGTTPSHFTRYRTVFLPPFDILFLPYHAASSTSATTTLVTKLAMNSPPVPSRVPTQLRKSSTNTKTSYSRSTSFPLSPHRIATTGLILSIPIAFISLRYRLPGTPTPKRLILSLAMLSTSFALIALTMASFATAGLKYTCDGFEAVHGPGSCRETFEMGLVDGSEPGAVHERSLEDLDKVVAWGWVMGISWAGYAGCEWGSWKVESVRWWWEWQIFGCCEFRSISSFQCSFWGVNIRLWLQLMAWKIKSFCWLCYFVLLFDPINWEQ